MEDARQEKIRVIASRAAEMGKPKTPGEATLRRLVQDPVTDEDHDANVEIDMECLQWNAIDLDPSKLGDPASECFGCIKNINHAVVNDDRLIKLVQLWTENRGYLSDDALAKEIYAYFSIYIRGPANKFASDEASMIPDWTPATILAHFMSHVITAETFLLNKIRSLNQFTSFLEHNALYKVNIHDPENVRVQEKAFRMWKEAIDLTKNLYATDASKMLLGGGQRISKKNYIRPKDATTSMSKPIESFFTSIKKKT